MTGYDLSKHGDYTMFCVRDTKTGVLGIGRTAKEAENMVLKENDRLRKLDTKENP